MKLPRSLRWLEVEAVWTPGSLILRILPSSVWYFHSVDPHRSLTALTLKAHVTEHWFLLLPIILQTRNLNSEKFSSLPRVTEKLEWTLELGFKKKALDQGGRTSAHTDFMSVYAADCMITGKAPLLSVPSFLNFRSFLCIWWCFPFAPVFRGSSSSA